jgi:hypothetical protein
VLTNRLQSSKGAHHLPRNLQEARDDQLLIPAVQAARNLGITRRALRNRINVGLVRSVHVGPRVYIPKTEIERIVNGEPAPISAPKPQTRDAISSSGNGAENGSTKSPQERSEELLSWCAETDRREHEELEQDATAGNREAIAAKAAIDALNAPVGPERQREIAAHHATWRTWRESKAQLACNVHATVLVTR